MSDTTPGVQAQHQAQLNAGQFLIQRCTGCSQHVYFPRESCPHCGAHDLQWVAPSGYGTVYSTTTIARKPEAGGNYNVSLIDLDEGVRLMSQPRPLRSVHRSEGWTAEFIAEHGMPALKASFVPLDRSADVFSWDPV